MLVFPKSASLCDGSFMYGYSLLELLLSLCIFSVCMLGFMHVQFANVRLATEALNRSTAGVIAQSVKENYLSSGQLIEERLWQDSLATLLPNGQGQQSLSQGVIHIGLSWKPMMLGSGANIESSFLYESQWLAYED